MGPGQVGVGVGCEEKMGNWLPVSVCQTYNVERCLLGAWYSGVGEEMPHGLILLSKEKNLNRLENKLCYVVAYRNKVISSIIDVKHLESSQEKAIQNCYYTL